MRCISSCLVLAFGLSACGVVPDSDRSSRPATGQMRLPDQSATAATPRSEETRLCLATLGATDAVFSALPDRHFAPGCHQLGTVQLKRLGSDKDAIAVSNIGPLACPIANTLAGWARFGVDRAAHKYLGSGLSRIETMGSYSCRNVAGTTRLSAHSRSEAIDISAFVLTDGRRISVRDGWNGGTRQERDFLRVIQQSACKRFGTVLGPDYNSDHRDHFHLEGRQEEGQGPAFCR